MAERTATLVLSGGGRSEGGIRGRRRARVAGRKGFQMDRIFGVSVGALNATLLAQEEYQRLKDFVVRDTRRGCL